MRILATLFCSVSLSALFAGNPVTPTITEVTVYRTGARITYFAAANVPSGVSEVILENISPHLVENSLQIKIDGNARMNHAIFQYIPDVHSPLFLRMGAVGDSLTLLEDMLAALQDEDDILESEASMLRENAKRVGTFSSTGQSGTLTVAQLQETADFFRKRLLEIHTHQQKLAKAIRKINSDLERLQQEIHRLRTGNNFQTGQLVLKVDANGAQELKITCTYFVRTASWVPLYDIFSDGLDKPLQLTYKANVVNSTGFDWKNVVLKLSTANPLHNNNRPVMSSEFVDFQQDISGIAAQFNIPAGAESNIYQREKVSAPNKVPITYDSSPVDIRSNGDEPLIGFELPGHQNIPSDGKMQTVILFEKSIPVDYEYHAAPKIEPAVFLLAKIGDFGQYNLLNGHANIFLQETFIGRTNVNPKITADTLLLSLGRDEQVTIDRIQPKDFTERRKIFGSKIRETCQYEISIKNNKSKPVTVDLIDQFPISKQKDIVVELGDHSGAKVSPEFGKLEWNVEIPAGQTKKIRFSYSVEYPKDKGVRYFKG